MFERHGAKYNDIFYKIESKVWALWWSYLAHILDDNNDDNNEYWYTMWGVERRLG